MAGAAAGFVAAIATIASAWLMSQVIATRVPRRGDARDRRAAARASSCSRPPCAPAGLWLLEVLAQRAGGRLQGRLRTDLVDRTFRLGPAWVAERRAGDLASVLTAGLDAIGAWMALYQPARLLAGSVPLLVLLVVVLIDPLSSLVLVLTGPGPAAPARGDRQPDAGDQRPPVRRAALAVRVLRRAAARPADAQGVRPQPRAGRHAARDQRPAAGDDDGRAAVRVPDGARARLGRGGRDGARRGADRTAADGRRDPVRPRARRPVHHARVLPAAAPARRSLPRGVGRADGRGPGVRDPRRAGAGRRRHAVVAAVVAAPGAVAVPAGPAPIRFEGVSVRYPGRGTRGARRR